MSVSGANQPMNVQGEWNILVKEMRLPGKGPGLHSHTDSDHVPEEFGMRGVSVFCA